MRSTTLGIAVCLLVVQFANAKPAPPGGPDREDVPYHATVSEVSKDGHVIHNRLDFDCEAAEGPGVWPPPKKIDCVLVQQDLQEPSRPLNKDELAKAVAEMTDRDKLKDLCQKESARPPDRESQQEEEFRKKVTKACDKKTRADVVASVTDLVREMLETASHTCTMMTFVSRITFTYVKKGVWVSHPDPFRNCPNVEITRTLRRDGTTSNWNYTEVTVATPSKDSLCNVAESGTTQFTWRQAFTASPLNCRYVQM